MPTLTKSDRDGFYAVPPSKVAAVVTFLEMTVRPVHPPLPNRFAVSLRRVNRPDPDWYRSLYREIGEEWLWFSRLLLADDELNTIIRDPCVDVYAVRHAGADKGLLELDRRQPPDIELAFFGIVRNLVGTGTGRWLMGQALDLAFAHAPRRVLVHTCTMDHPDALGFYIRCGFRPYKRAIEVADDPRLSGVLPRNVGAHVPVIE